MRVSYKELGKLLIDRDIKKKDLQVDSRAKLYHHCKAFKS